MCRKNILKMLSKFASVGSLPRVQEKQCSLCKWWNTIRITPACAGKTQIELVRQFWGWDHSRVCGKNHKLLRTWYVIPGSPPRVREKRVCFGNEPRRPGITPACAGKTMTFLSRLMKSWDHPRVCGKNKDIFLRFQSGLGSPPRVREKQILHRVEN